MGGKRKKEEKRKALLAHKRRMAKHGRKKIAITSSTIAEALKVPAKKPRNSKINKSLTHRDEIVIVCASVADIACSRAVKQPKYPRSVRLKRSKKLKRIPDSREISPAAALEVRTVQNKPKETSGNHPFAHDGQPRFEGGFRIIQGGLVEQGKRR
ncbi:MAG: hypothetical protein ABI064_04345 [Acidobacteriaceae bacterium]